MTTADPAAATAPAAAPAPERPGGAFRALGAAACGFAMLLPVDIFVVVGVDAIEVAWTTVLVVASVAFLGWRLGTEARRNGWSHFAYGLAAHGWLLVGTMAWMCTLYLDGMWDAIDAYFAK